MYWITCNKINKLIRIRVNYWQMIIKKVINLCLILHTHDTFIHIYLYMYTIYYNDVLCFMVSVTRFRNVVNLEMNMYYSISHSFHYTQWTIIYVTVGNLDDSIFVTTYKSNIIINPVVLLCVIDVQACCNGILK